MAKASGKEYDRTSVTVQPSTADELHSRKSRGESYDDVIRRLLGLEE